MITQQIQSVEETPELKGFRATAYQIKLIDQAAKLDKRSRSQFVLHSALLRAKKIIREHHDQQFLEIQAAVGYNAVSESELKSENKKVEQ